MGNICFGRSRKINHYTTKSLNSETPWKTNKNCNNNNHKNTNNNGNGKLEDRDYSDAEKQTANNNGKSSETQLPPSSGRIVTPNLKMFTLQNLRAATRNFRPDSILGEGGFGTVFKGWLDPETYAPSKVGVGMPVAVKKSNPNSLQGLQEWQCEVKFLGKFSHPSLVKLLGYCWEDKQFLLVYEYMPKGSLENHLFQRGVEPLGWETRMKIGIGAAQGLAFLHTSEKSVIFRDFKASNILLDGDFNAKLSDFGLAKLGPSNGDSHVTTRVMGTYGYAAPEYVATGHLYVNSDVYGFGVVLLEMLTGLRALDTTRPTGQNNLVEWAKSSLSDKRKLRKIMDPRLGEKYPIKAALKAAELILKCLESDPKKRPSSEEVLDTLLQITTTKDKHEESQGSKTKSRPGGVNSKRCGHSNRHHNLNYPRPSLHI